MAEKLRVQLENSEQVLIGVHSPDKCVNPERCTIHNMTDHPMRSFAQAWRLGKMERICPHGVGHPDPDEYRLLSGEIDGVHGCDGCCEGSY